MDATHKSALRTGSSPTESSAGLTVDQYTAKQTAELLRLSRVLRGRPDLAAQFSRERLHTFTAIRVLDVPIGGAAKVSFTRFPDRSFPARAACSSL